MKKHQHFQKYEGIKVVADKENLIEYCTGVPLDEIEIFDLCDGVIDGVFLLLFTVILGPFIILSRKDRFFIQGRVGRNGRTSKYISSVLCM